jgi:hypothetical protein
MQQNLDVLFERWLSEVNRMRQRYGMTALANVDNGLRDAWEQYVLPWARIDRGTAAIDDDAPHPRERGVTR